MLLVAEAERVAEVRDAAWAVQLAVHGMACGLTSPLGTVIEPGLMVLGDLDYAAFALAEDGPVLAAAGHGELVTCCRAALVRARAGGYDDRLPQEMLRLLDDLARISGAHLPPPAAPGAGGRG